MYIYINDLSFDHLTTFGLVCLYLPLSLVNIMLFHSILI